MTTSEPVRERTHTWDDPLVTAAAAVGVDGITFLRAIAEGSVPQPPYIGTIGMELESVEPGRVVFTLVPREFHFNPIGSVHGGVYASLLDSACGCAVQSLLPAGVRYTSLDLTVKFLRALSTESGRVRCEGTVLHRGGRTALAEARIVDEHGRLCAYASSSCLIITPGR